MKDFLKAFVLFFVGWWITPFIVWCIAMWMMWPWFVQAYDQVSSVLGF